MVIPIAKTNFRSQERVFGIKPDDRRRHMYVIGKTGMGKTVLLQNMTIADIQSGNGLAVIDPHGEYAEELLDYIPPHRINDVIYFNPADLDYPIAFNAVEQVAPETRHLVASGLMGVFKKIWPDVWSARMEYILNYTILALLEYPNSTLLGIMKILSNKDYRKKVLEKVSDPMVKSFWLEEYASYNEKFEKEAIAPIQNKVGQFIAAPLIRNIIGQTKSSINMREVMDTGKILIVNLSKGRIGEDNSKLLGGMLVTKLQLAAMSRVDIPEHDRRDFFLYVDEFQNFATDSFADILSEARKYRLSLVLAHQYIAQLPETVRDAVFGNVGTLISFRVGAEDAEFLEREFVPEFMAADLVNLAKTNVYLKLMIDGVASKPFSATTLPPQSRPAKNYREAIIRVSRERYAKSRKEVEEKISRWAAVSPSFSGPSKGPGQGAPRMKPERRFQDQQFSQPTSQPRRFSDTPPSGERRFVQPKVHTFYKSAERGESNVTRGEAMETRETRFTRPSQPAPKPPSARPIIPEEKVIKPVASEKPQEKPKIISPEPNMQKPPSQVQKNVESEKKEEVIPPAKTAPVTQAPEQKTNVPLPPIQTSVPRTFREDTRSQSGTRDQRGNGYRNRDSSYRDREVPRRSNERNQETPFRARRPEGPSPAHAPLPPRQNTNPISLKEAFLEKETTSFGNRPVKKDVDRSNLKKLIESSLDSLEKTKENIKPRPSVSSSPKNQPVPADNSLGHFALGGDKKPNPVILKPGEKIFFNQKKNRT